jgi:signal transduction histidine kinase
LAVFAYRYRVQHRIRQFQRAQEAQQAFARQLIASQENERKRIAAELHDSLGQHLLIIKNRAVIGERLAAEHGPLREQLDEINASATQAISEARAIAYNLRPLHLDRLGLTAVLEEMIEKVARASGIEFSADIEPLDGVFTPEGEINFYRIIQESINNIVKHARATRAAVEIWREDGDLHVTVRDDGRGFDAGALSDSTVKAPVRGFGLTGISERVRMLGGAQTIISTPGQGATLTIRIPLQDSAGGAEHAT